MVYKKMHCMSIAFQECDSPERILMMNSLLLWHTSTLVTFPFVLFNAHRIGLLVQLKNIVYKELCSLLEQETDPVGVPAYVQKEPVAFIRLAQEKWEGKLKQAINKLCIDFRAPLAREVCETNNMAHIKYEYVGTDRSEIP